MHIAFHPRAVEDVTTIDGWWKVNRPAAPDLFRRELEDLVMLVATSPTLGTPADTGDHDFFGVRRALMRRTRYHLYYRTSRTPCSSTSGWRSTTRTSGCR